ncbi:MAG: hypothetical protein HKN19_12880, partial [Halioglobus sp.]|nr:hypothetical protein [Halioglobus sp.]
LYTRAELAALFADHLPARQANKAGQLAAIDELALTDVALIEMLTAFEPGRIIAPLCLEVIAVLQLLFFGNRYQSLTEFVLADLGVVTYFAYPLDRSARKFATRAALEEYLALCALSDTYREQLEEGVTDQLPAVAEQVLGLTIEHESSTNRHARLCNALARELERLEELELALALYAQSGRHPARERTARVRERCGDWAGARAQCEAILAAPQCEEEQDAATRILPRMLRKLGEKPQPRPRDDFARIDLAVMQGDTRVELLAAEALASDWQAVHYVENSLMNTLFGLAFWQQIFEPLPGVFHHAYQGAPADMYDSEFLARRQSSIADRIEELRASDIESLLLEAFDTYYPCQCHWVDWRYITREIVASAARCIPKAHLLAIWQRQLFDPAGNRRGFPDLVAFGKAQGEYALVEVKGPGDALQDSQKRWLRFFARQGIPASVAWVEWRDD